MSESPLTQRRLQVLQHYINAMECGDIETIAAVREDATHDQGLEHMLLEVNAVYQHEDRTIVRAVDAVAAQQIILKLAHQTIGREKMHNSSLNGQNEPAHAVLHIAQTEQVDNNNQAPQKTPGKKFATPVFPARMVASPKWYSSRKSWIAASAAAILIAILLLPGTSALASQFLSLFTVKNF